MLTKHPLALNALLFSALMATSAAALADDKTKPQHDHAAMAGHSAGSMELHRIMEQGGKQPMDMTGDVDRDFARMMSMHHQQAMKMSDVLLKHGKNAELRALAQKMKDQQAKEIQQMAPHK
jgi:uncharacterized protein (DUF305 family)